MAIQPEERYKLIFGEHHYAGDCRHRFFRAWCIMIAALAAAFVWVQQSAKPLSWLVAAVAFLITVLLWIADARNRAAVGGSKDVGQAIEQNAASGIPEAERYFTKLHATGFVEKLLTHSRALDVFFGLVSLALAGATIYLACKRGQLPQ